MNGLVLREQNSDHQISLSGPVECKEFSSNYQLIKCKIQFLDEIANIAYVQGPPSHTVVFDLARLYT